MDVSCSVPLKRLHTGIFLHWILPSYHTLGLLNGVILFMHNHLGLCWIFGNAFTTLPPVTRSEGEKKANIQAVLNPECEHEISEAGVCAPTWSTQNPVAESRRREASPPLAPPPVVFFSALLLFLLLLPLLLSPVMLTLVLQIPFSLSHYLLFCLLLYLLPSSFPLSLLTSSVLPPLYNKDRWRHLRCRQLLWYTDIFISIIFDIVTNLVSFTRRLSDSTTEGLKSKGGVKHLLTISALLLVALLFLLFTSPLLFLSVNRTHPHLPVSHVLTTFF